MKRAGANEVSLLCTALCGSALTMLAGGREQAQGHVQQEFARPEQPVLQARLLLHAHVLCLTCP